METFLRIGNRIIMVEWQISYSYTNESYNRWRALRMNPDENAKEIAELESVNCMRMFYVTCVSIIETYNANEARTNITSLSGNEFTAIQGHIKANQKEEDVLAKDVYRHLLAQEEIPF